MHKLLRFYRLLRKHKFLQIRFKIINKLYKFFFKKELLPPLPYSITVEPTNICNLCCPICPSAYIRTQRSARTMSLGEFRGIIDQVRSFTEEMLLFHNGEPFLNPDLLKMIRYAVSANMLVIVNTNGHFFESRDFVVELIKSGLNRLIVSVDGKDQETYGIYRIGGDLEKVLKGLRLIIETKKELKSKTPTIELQFMLMKHNVHQREEMKQLAKEMGADVYSEKTINLIINNTLTDPDAQNLLKKFLPSDLAFSRFELKDGRLNYRGEITNCCSWVEQSTVIESDGTVIPCCYDSFFRYAMGNVFETPLKDIWKGKPYQNLRLEIKRNRKNLPVCNMCCLGRGKGSQMIIRNVL